MALHGNRKHSSAGDMNRIDLRNRAFKLISEKSFFRGEFTLASGKTSNYYLDMKPTMFDPEGSHALAALVIDKLSGMDVELVGGLEMGAVPLVSTVALLSSIQGWPLPGFFVRKSVKSHGTKKLVEGTSNVAGKRVVILDDVTTTGDSAKIAVDAVREAGATVVLVLSVVDRDEGAAENFARDGIPFAWLFRAEELLKA